jgi:hypothetical protein
LNLAAINEEKWTAGEQPKRSRAASHAPSNLSRFNLQALAKTQKVRDDDVGSSISAVIKRQKENSDVKIVKIRPEGGETAPVIDTRDELEQMVKLLNSEDVTLKHLSKIKACFLKDGGDFLPSLPLPQVTDAIFKALFGHNKCDELAEKLLVYLAMPIEKDQDA